MIERNITMAMTTHKTDIASASLGSAIVITSGITILIALIVVGVLAAVVMMALTPPRTHLEFAGMLCIAVSSSCFGGPLIIEWYALGALSITAQLGICFIAAAPAWLIARIVANQLGRWRDSKNPISTIANDVRDIKHD